MVQRSIALILAGVFFASGCREGHEPPPQFNAAMEVGGRTFVPTVVPKYSHDRSILAAAAQPEDIPAVAKPAATTSPAEAAIAIDDSTPEAIVETFIKISESQNPDLQPQIMVPEQQEIIRKMSEAETPMVQAFDKLKAAFAKAFPDQRLPDMPLPGGGAVPMGGGKIEVENINKISETEAEATMKITGMPQPLMLKLRSIEGAWRIEIPGLPPSEMFDQVLERMANMPQAIEAMAERIANGEFATGQEAAQALSNALQQAAGAGQPSGGLQPSEDASVDVQPSAAAPDRPKELKREEVDEVYSGPGMLRTGR